MTVLEVIGLEKTYKQKQALAPFELTVSAGECIVLAGGNGAGKSTLLNILAGISKPSGGKAKLKGIDLEWQRHQYTREIGYMPDDFLAQEQLTAKEFLSFYGELRKTGKERIAEVISMIGLNEKQDELLRRLSKGMRQRLLFGQAMIGNPALLLLDEPTNGLDPMGIKDMRELIEMLNKEYGMTFLISSHILAEVQQVADREVMV